jgi:hypothetical protein
MPPARHAAMEAKLEPIAAALSELEENELQALVVAANELVLMAAGLLSWIEHLADWELNRRSGLDFPLQPPEVAIPPEEDAESIVAATMMRDGFVDGGSGAGAVASLFDAIVGALTGKDSQH